MIYLCCFSQVYCNMISLHFYPILFSFFFFFFVCLFVCFCLFVCLFVLFVYFLLCAFLYCVLMLSFFSRSRSDMAWMMFLFNQGGSSQCFTRLWRIGACLLTTSMNSLYHTARAWLGSMCWSTLSNGVHVHKRCQPRIFCLQKRRSLNVSAAVLRIFYRSGIESVLTFSFLCRFGGLEACVCKLRKLLICLLCNFCIWYVTESLKLSP